MNLETLEKIVGPIKRGQLSGNFKPDLKHYGDEIDEVVNPSASKKVEPPPCEDMSHLNPKYTRRLRESAQKSWRNLPPEKKKARAAHLVEAGKLGGAATKDIRHLNGA